MQPYRPLLQTLASHTRLRLISNESRQSAAAVAAAQHLTGAFNRKPRSSKIGNLVIKAKPTAAGLFARDDLTSPDGFERMRAHASQRVDLLAKEVLDPARRRLLVSVFDEMSDTICQLADLAEFVRIMHPNADYQAAADAASRRMHQLVEELNTNVDLYRAMRRVADTGDDVVPTDDIDRRVAQLFLPDFEQSGIHLDEATRRRVVELNAKILRVGALFAQNAMEPRRVAKTQVPPAMRQSIEHRLTSGGDESILVGSQMPDSADSRVREIAYKIFLMPDVAQESRLAELVKLRYELAKLTGYKSFAERGLEHTLISTHESLHHFLNSLSDVLRPLAADDYAYMLFLKKQREPSATELLASDTTFYSALARQEHAQLGGIDLSHYFPLGACIDGLSRLVERLFGLRLELDATQDELLWSPDVYKLRVVRLRSDTESEDETLGFIYCDFYDRPRKPAQDCHFTIRCGRQLSPTDYQLPIVVLCLGLPSPGSSSEPSLLQPQHVENLFHEMGHALHSMLGRTRYQHVTGTRCSTDFAEVPSTIFELFAQDPRVLASISAHYRTGEKLGVDLLRRYCHGKRLCQAADLQLQCFYAMLDLAYHGRDAGDGDDTTVVLRDMCARHYGLPYVEHTAWQLRFGHLAGYGGRYYAYLLSKALASLIWRQLFGKEPFRADSGRLLSERLLRFGGEREPMQLVEQVLGYRPTSSDLVDALVDLTHTNW